jgi:hypothetical protein
MNSTRTVAVIIQATSPLSMMAATAGAASAAASAGAASWPSAADSPKAPSATALVRRVRATGAREVGSFIEVSMMLVAV